MRNIGIFLVLMSYLFSFFGCAQTLIKSPPKDWEKLELEQLNCTDSMELPFLEAGAGIVLTIIGVIALTRTPLTDEQERNLHIATIGGVGGGSIFLGDAFTGYQKISKCQQAKQKLEYRKELKALQPTPEQEEQKKEEPNPSQPKSPFDNPF